MGPDIHIWKLPRRIGESNMKVIRSEGNTYTPCTRVINGMNTPFGAEIKEEVIHGYARNILSGMISFMRLTRDRATRPRSCPSLGLVGPSMAAPIQQHNEGPHRPWLLNY